MRKTESVLKSMIKGIVTDIQRASVHDGPGLRTTVFFKGCPLKCEWCHNPECIDFKPQILFYPEKCIGCGMCDKGCFSDAKVVCGTEMTTEDVVEQILLDKEYYQENGGVTFSGGEPFAQPEFLRELIDKCKRENIHCAVETSLIYFYEEILREIDLVMADFKIWDDGLHRKHTGVSNEQIKENFKKLNSLNIPIIARTPIIPGIEQGVDKISEFMRGLDNVVKYELLPYHPLGVSKQIALGTERKQFNVPEKEYMKALNKFAFESEKID